MKLNFEGILLLIFFSLLLWMCYANFSNNKISHEFPYGYLASDAFQHQARAEHVKEQGNYKTELPAMVAGFKDIAGFYQPITSHLAAAVSLLSGIESYDSIQMMTALAISALPLVIYFIIKHFSKNAAILSLPLMTLLFTKKFYFGFLFGQWPFIMGAFFLTCAAWATVKINTEKMWLLLAIFLSATLMSHVSELIFILGFIFMTTGIKLIRKGLTKEELKNIIFPLIIFIIITAYQWLLIKKTWVAHVPYKFAVETTTSGAFPDVFVSEFGLLIIPIAIGILFGLAILLKKTNAPLLFGYYMIIIGFTNLIGFGVRAFQIRFLWPAFLSIFFGLGIYQPARIILRKWKPAYAIILSVILILAFVKVYYTSNQPNQGIMDQYHWEAFKWLKQNTEEEKNILFLYGQTYQQTSVLYNTWRVNYYVDLNDYASGVKQNYHIILANDIDAGLIYKTGLLGFANHLDEINKSIFNYNANICGFDYYVMDKYGGENALVQRNSEIKEKLASEGMQVAFENPTTTVIKNNERKDCKW